MRRVSVDRVKNAYMLDLIGSSIMVVDHPDPTIRGREGSVIDETMHTLLISENDKMIRIPKSGGSFRLRIECSGKSIWIDLDGDHLDSRPEDRCRKNERIHPVPEDIRVKRGVQSDIRYDDKYRGW